MIDLESAVRALGRSGGALAIVVAAKTSRVAIGAKSVLDRAGNVVAGDGLGGELETQLGDLARAALEAGEPRLVNLEDESCGGRVTVYIEPAVASAEVLVLGSSPVGAALARIAPAAGFALRVRAPDATPERYPLARETVKDDSYESVPAPGATTHVVVTTSHEADEAALKAALRGKPASVQLVSSAKRARAMLAALQDEIDREQLAKVRTPAGLDLGGDSPDEIALAILAEIVALRRGGSARPLVEAKGPILAEESEKPEKGEKGEKASRGASGRQRILPKNDDDEDAKEKDADEDEEPTRARVKAEPAPKASSGASKRATTRQPKRKLDVEIIDFRPKDADDDDEFRGPSKKS